MHKDLLNENSLLVKVAGGATSQCLALMNAIYVKNRTGRDFKIKYFPFSTGTYWPFEIDFLLEKNEKIQEIGSTKGFDSKLNQVTVGKIINNHPLQSRWLNYEKILVLIRKVKLESIMFRLRGEVLIMASKKNLDRVGVKTKAISGGYAALSDKNVCGEMDARFKRANLNSPFSKEFNGDFSPRVVIHLRIGDKRDTFTNPLVGRDGITDPAVFVEILSKLKAADYREIFVVSDEPIAAQKLLAQVGIVAKLNPKSKNIWDDVFFMSQASIFIGSWSQVSQLAALCVLNNGGVAYCPDSNQVGDKSVWHIDGVHYYRPRFLGKENKIYSTE